MKNPAFLCSRQHGNFVIVRQSGKDSPSSGILDAFFVQRRRDNPIRFREEVLRFGCELRNELRVFEHGCCSGHSEFGDVVQSPIFMLDAACEDPQGSAKGVEQDCFA